uniref:hypothetical protein n=1 Tax=Candidatus Symbiothrix dinenymphae TaxID=467085 RepID=UPI000AE8E1A1
MKVKLCIIMLCIGVGIPALAQDEVVEAVAQDILVRGGVVNEKQRPLPGGAVSVDGEASLTDTNDAK